MGGCLLVIGIQTGSHQDEGIGTVCEWVSGHLLAVYKLVGGWMVGVYFMGKRCVFF